MDAQESAVSRRIEEISRELRQVVGNGEHAGILALFLYGSALNRLFRPDSDLDVAILDSSEHPLSWQDQARLMDAFERATGRGIDLRLLRESSLSHQAHVLEQGWRLWTRDPGEVERYTLRVLEEAGQARERNEAQWSQTLHRLARTA
jgi:predicted nucleotidyltransferase